ncbi:putative N-acetyltransferase [Senna tora]|uniref:Putative N-acetyltransferase n=1 Tax=Senna tora TaxID=362788 RepID=A0A834XEI2_9FABA|nr:putative N-acetyltransferase [Senna tora]
MYMAMTLDIGSNLSKNGPVKAVQVLLLSVSGSVPAEKGKYSVKFTVSLKDDAFGWDGTPLLVAAKVGKTGKFSYKEVNLSYVSSRQTIPSETGDGLTIDVNEDKAEEIHFGLYELSKKKWKGGLEIHSAISVSTPPSICLKSLSDADDLLVWATNEKVTKFYTWEPYTSKDNAISFITNIATQFLWFRAICLNDRTISVSSYVGGHKYRRKSGEIEYVLGSKYWGKGKATKAVKESVGVEGNRGLERVGALVDVENVGFQRVLEKIFPLLFMMIAT